MPFNWPSRSRKDSPLSQREPIFCLDNWVHPLDELEPSGKQADQPTIRKRALIFFSILGVGSLFQYGYGWGLNYFGGYSYPFTSPLYLPEGRFMDFFLPGWWSIIGGQNNYAPFATLINRLMAYIIDFSNGPYEARNTISGFLCLGSMVVFF